MPKKQLGLAPLEAILVVDPSAFSHQHNPFVTPVKTILNLSNIDNPPAAS